MPKPMTDHVAEVSTTARMRRSVDTFRVSARGFRRVFSRHFGEGNADVESVAYHLGQVEAVLPTMREAIRLARYPGAGNRNPKRMALGLVENLSLLETHIREANAALGRLARSHNGRPAKSADAVTPVTAAAPKVAKKASSKKASSKKASPKKRSSK